jgi:TRAP-type C4-dicarboxylate transport system substrate-binding protein
MMRSVLVALGIAALLCGPVVAQAKTIKLATLAPKGSPWHEILLDMAAEWEAAAHGSLKVRVYPGGVLGDEPDLMRKMAIGQIDGAMVTAAGLTKLVPDMWVFGMPMIVRSYGELDYMRDGIASELQKQFRERGYMVLNWGEAGWVRFFSNTKVTTPDDLRGIKLFVWAGDPVTEAAWRAERFSIVPLPATELFSALQSGMVDAYATTTVASLSFQWFGMAPHMLDLNWAPLVGATIIRLESWNELPEPTRVQMLAAAEEAGRRFRERTRSFEAEAVRVMMENGLTVNEMTPEVLDLWEAGAQGAREVIRRRYVSPQLVAHAQKLLAEYRAGPATPAASN